MNKAIFVAKIHEFLKIVKVVLKNVVKHEMHFFNAIYEYLIYSIVEKEIVCVISIQSL